MAEFYASLRLVTPQSDSWRKLGLNEPTFFVSTGEKMSTEVPFRLGIEVQPQLLREKLGLSPWTGVFAEEGGIMRAVSIKARCQAPTANWREWCNKEASSGWAIVDYDPNHPFPVGLNIEEGHEHQRFLKTDPHIKSCRFSNGPEGIVFFR